MRRPWLVSVLLAGSTAVALIFAGCGKPAASTLPPLHVWVRSSGTSMLPTVPTSSWNELELIDYSALRLGDVVVCWNNAHGGYILHRIVSFEDGHWVTAGDNNPSNDRGLLTSDVYRGRFIRWSLNPI